MEYLFEIIVIILLSASAFFGARTYFSKNDNAEELSETFDEVKGLNAESLERVLSKVKELDETLITFKSPMTSIDRYLTGGSSLAGDFGEWGLQAVIEDTLPENLFKANHSPNPATNHTVEYAVKMPGTDDLFLSIDAKLPAQRFKKFVEAQSLDERQLKEAKQEFKSELNGMAEDIKEKYIVQNHTPNFAIMFVLENINKAIDELDDFRQSIYKKYKVIILGPNNLTSYLNTLLMAHESVHVNQEAMAIFSKVEEIKREFSLFSEAISENELRTRQSNDAAKTLLSRRDKVNKKINNLLQLSADDSKQKE